ncbi:molybdopterin cofactor-binding domain-containing protein, partial [Pseudomonas syringae]|nr:molybdopterin cofactor-binding domain-containing protein [Pseudomonas syringae]
FDDHKLQGMLHLKVVRSAHPHARLRRIDTSEAERSQGVRRVIRASDVPRNLNTLLSLINFGKDDEPSLAVDKVRYKGEPIVAIVADSPREADEAIAKVKIDYEVLPAVFDVEEALKPGAPVVWPEAPDNIVAAMSYGDAAKVEAAFASAAHKVSLDLISQRLVPSAMEPRSTIAEIEKKTGRLILHV